MRKLLLIVVSFVTASALATAQRHLNTYETPVKGTLTVASDVMVGTWVLPEGVYSYSCDRENITFANPNTGKVVVKVPCEGRELSTPAKETTMHLKTDASGKKVVTKLLLKGSNIEHVFK